MTTSAQVTTSNRSNFRTYLLLLLVAAVTFGIFFYYHNRNLHHIDQDYLYQLNEVQQQFSQQITRVGSLCHWGDKAALEANYPSISDVKNCKPGDKTSFTIDPGRLSFVISSKINVSLIDLFSKLNHSFSDLYLIDSKGNVYERTAHNTSQFSGFNGLIPHFKEQQRPSLQRLFTTNPSVMEGVTSLPQQSSVIDYHNAGDAFRLYLQPLLLPQIKYLQHTQNEQFFLIGLVNKAHIENRTPISHNIAFLLWGILGLGVVYFAAFMYWFPINQSQPLWLKPLSLTIYCAFFIVSCAFALSQAYKYALIEQRLDTTSEFLALKIEDIAKQIKTTATALKQQQTTFNSDVNLADYSDYKAEKGCFGSGLSNNKTNDLSQPSHTCTLALLSKNLLKSSDDVYAINSDGRSSAFDINQEQIVTSFAANAKGKIWRSVNYSEKPLVTDNYTVGHRDYFIKQRQHNAWVLNGSAFYLQRLFNIADGSLGTTISLPMDSKPGFILGADLYLPSIYQLTPTAKDSAIIGDLVTMIINPVTGEVLFHSDNSHSLQENFYQFNQEQKLFKTWLMPESSEKPHIRGYYHGDYGYFLQQDLGIGPLKIVGFIPSYNLRTFANNQFVYLTLVLTALVLLMLIATAITKHSKQKLIALPSYPVVALLSTLMGCSILLTLNFTLDWRYDLQALLLVVVFAIFYLLTTRIMMQMPKRQTISIMVILLAWAFLLPFQSFKGSEFALQQQQKLQQQFTLQNNAQQQLAFFNEFYPNSIDKITGLDELISKANQFGDSTARPVRQLTPTNLEQSTQLKLFLPWLEQRFESPESSPSPLMQQSGLARFLYFIGILALAGFIWVFLKLIKPRVFLSSSLIKHIQLMQEMNQQAYQQLYEQQDHQTRQLYIQLGVTKINGDLWSARFTTCHRGYFTYKNAFNLASSNDLVEQQSFPGLKFNLNPDTDHIELFDIELALEHPDTRVALFDLICEIKQKVESGQFKYFTLHCNSASLQKLSWQSGLGSSHDIAFQPLDHANLLRWAECLMDFQVIMGPELQRYYHQLDKTFCLDEQQALPELSHLDLNLLKFSHSGQASRSHTISYLLHLFEATYRYKWENCSDLEKLALYQLAANKHQPNPCNAALISALAQKGLIKYHQGKLEIINHSFKVFIKSAQSDEEFRKLEQQAQVGTWQQFKIPFTIMIIIAVIGLAMSSGESIFVVLGAASAALSSIFGIKSQFGAK
ncbi:hypothetical protein [Paraferrimonas sp. SM1919]|uniref:hypothetical protein n=1 Tax=Paraferrimonas sp. SM1919 TaxID=2662263 RepID=UPI0013D8A9E4|nr:hypothetical protein [Paraferrimonas sp. SM1919]